MSAMLSCLRLEPFRAAVLSSTGGRIDSSSRLSRLAEQLGQRALEALALLEAVAARLLRRRVLRERNKSLHRVAV
jgi:hypothetical protein